MEQSLSWEANRRSVSQEIPSFFMEPKGPLLCLKETAIRPYLGPFESSPYRHTLFL
jgi:hypothetical protein